MKLTAERLEQINKIRLKKGYNNSVPVLETCELFEYKDRLLISIENAKLRNSIELIAIHNSTLQELENRIRSEIA